MDSEKTAGQAYLDVAAKDDASGELNAVKKMLRDIANALEYLCAVAEAAGSAASAAIDSLASGITSVSNGLTSLINTVASHFDTIAIGAATIASAFTELAGITSIVSGLGSALAAVTPILMTVIGAITAFAVANPVVAASILVVVFAAKYLLPVVQILYFGLKLLQDVASALSGVLYSGLATALWALSLPFKAILLPVNLLISALGMLWSAIDNTIGFGIRLATALPGAIIGAFVAIGRAANELQKKLVETLVAGGAAVVALAKTVATSTANFLGRAITNPGETLVAPIVSALTTATDFIGAKLQAIGDYFIAAGRKVATFGVSLVEVAAIIIGPLTSASNEFMKFGNEMRKGANTAGIAVDKFAALAFAADEIGVSAEKVGDAVEAMTEKLEKMAANDIPTVRIKSEIDMTPEFALDPKKAKGVDLDPKTVQVVDDLGLSVKELLEMDAEERFIKIGQAINAIADDSTRPRFAEELFGKENKKVLKIFAEGLEGLEQARKKAEGLGQIISPEDAKNAKGMKSAFDELKTGLAGIAIQAGSIVAPAIKEATEQMISVVKIAITWIKENRELIATAFRVASAIATAGAVITTIGGAIAGVGSIFGGVAGIAAVVSAAIAGVGGALVAVLSPMAVLIAGLSVAGVGLTVWLNPLALLRSALSALGPTWTRFHSEASEAVKRVMATFDELSGWAGKVFGGIRAAIDAGSPAQAITIALTAAKVAMLRGLVDMASISDRMFGGLFGKLAEGDFAGAFESIGQALEVAFETAIAKILPLWSQVKGAVDATVTYIRQAWNTALGAMAEGIRMISFELAKMLDAAAKWDPTGAAQKAADKIRSIGGSKLVSGLLNSEAPNQKLDKGLAKREAARAAELQKQLDAADTRLTKLKADRDAAAAAGDKTAASKLEAMRAELKAAIEAAELAKKNKAPRDLPDLARNANIKVEEAAKATRASGGFGGAAARALASGSAANNDQKDIKKNTAAAVTALNKVNENLTRLDPTVRLA